MARISLSFTLLLAALGAPLALVGQSIVSTNAFQSPGSFEFANGVDDLHVAELASSGNSDQSTHLLIQGIVPVEEGSNVVTSSYTAINVDAGDEPLELGQLYFTMPANATSPGSAASPIVGIVPREGSWSGYDLNDPEAPLGGARGFLQIDEEAGTLGLSLGLDGTVYTGETSYTRIDDATVELADFSLSNDSGAIEFYGTQLFHLGERIGAFYGVIQSKDADADLDSLMYAINLDQIPDFDGDTVPDLADADTGPFRPVVENYKYDYGTGWLWGWSADWGYSHIYGNVFTDYYPWLWVHNHGYVYYQQRDGEIVWLWDDALQEHLYTGDFGGQYGVYSEDEFWARRFY